MGMKVTSLAKDVNRTGIMDLPLARCQKAAERGMPIRVLTVCDHRRHDVAQKLPKTDPVMR